MKFNIHTCKVVHYRRNNIKFQYSLYGQSIAEVSEKDLGVVFSNDIKVGVQCRAVQPSQSVSWFHSQNHKAQESVVPLYKSMVRPHLEYRSAA